MPVAKRKTFRWSRSELIIAMTLIEILILLVFTLMLSHSMIKEKSDKYEEIEKELKKHNFSYEQFKIKYQEIWSTLTSKASPENKLSNLIAENEKLKSESESLRKENERLSGKGGLDEKPCWLNTGGRPEYLFVIELYDDKFIVHRAWPASRKDDSFLTKLEDFPFDQDVNKEKFLLSLESLLQEADNQRCRHYVRIEDKTSNKECYKNQLRIVETYFYKYLEN